MALRGPAKTRPPELGRTRTQEGSDKDELSTLPIALLVKFITNLQNVKSESCSVIIIGQQPVNCKRSAEIIEWQDRDIPLP